MILTVFRSLLITLVLATTLLNGSEQEIQNLQNYYGERVLIVFIECGDFDTVQALLDRGTNPHLQDERGQTALMIASKTHQIDIVKLLLKHGAAQSINKQSKEGNTALLETVYIALDLIEEGAVEAHGDNLTKKTCAIIKLLLDHGANPHIKNKYGKTVLDYVTYTYRSPLHHKLINALLYDREYYKGTPEHRQWPSIFGDRYRSSTSSKSIENKRTILKMLMKHGVKLTRWQQFTWKV